MKMRFTLLAAAAAMLLTAQAETLTFQMGVNDGSVILQDGKFNPQGCFIGNTGPNTVIEVGEVDFGEGDVYNAASIRYANGWSNGGVAVLSAGQDFESAVPFANIALINMHDSYIEFRSIGANFEAAPTGVQKVYLSFIDRAGNIMDVRLYNDEFVADDFEDGSLLKEPHDLAGYGDVATMLSVTDENLVYSPSADTRIDGDSWGWTSEGVVVNYGTLDFGNGDYKQVVIGIKSIWPNDANNSIDVYIDDYNNDDNLIANVWAINGDNGYRAVYYLARNIEEISGEHTVYLKWHGGSINVMTTIEFVKDYLWSLGPVLDPIVTTYENEQPSDKAVCYSFRKNMMDDPNYIGRVFVQNDQGEYAGQNYSNRTTILNRGQWEDDNVGYTGDGTVLKITGIDFQEGQFDKILVSHSTGMSWAGYIDEANFKFYIDLEDNGTTDPTVSGAPRRIVVEDWANVRDQLTDIEPVSTVRLQATSGWGNVYTTKGDLSKVEGVHDVYIVYTAPDGANIKDIYLDDQEENTDPSTGVNNITAAKVVNNNVYTIDGRLVRKNATSLDGLASGLYIFNGNKYIVK